MTSYDDRLDLLELTVNSYLKTKTRPNKFYIFDDNSKNIFDVYTILSKIPEAIIIRNDKNYGSDGNITNAMKVLFELGADITLALDSDCLFDERWWERTKDIGSNINLDENLICLFNARVHKYVKSARRDFVHKEILGGLGLLISKKIFTAYIEKIRNSFLGLIGWDGKLCKYSLEDGINLLACSPSMIQHIGFKKGAHSDIDMTECIADDFVGDNSEILKIMSDKKYDRKQNQTIVKIQSTNKTYQPPNQINLQENVPIVHNLHPERRPNL
jgi:hypothetical protein